MNIANIVLLNRIKW